MTFFLGCDVRNMCVSRSFCELKLFPNSFQMGTTVFAICLAMFLQIAHVDPSVGRCCICLVYGAWLCTCSTFNHASTCFRNFS